VISREALFVQNLISYWKICDDIFQKHLAFFSSFLPVRPEASEAGRCALHAARRAESRMLLTATLDHFITTEHTDLHSAYSTGGGWSLTIDEDLQGEMAREDALLYVGTNAQANRPGSSEWAFTGVGAGQPFFFGGQTQEDGLLYLGASSYDVPGSLITTTNPFTESKGRFNGTGKWGKFSLVDVQHTNPDGTPGTGVFSAWSSGTFGEPTVLMSSYNDNAPNPNGQGLDTTDGISGDDAWWLINGGHAHYNFGFPNRGVTKFSCSFRRTSRVAESFQVLR
jgi:hypothetical protein